MAQEENIHLFNISECKYKFTFAQRICGYSKQNHSWIIQGSTILKIIMYNDYIPQHTYNLKSLKELIKKDDLPKQILICSSDQAKTSSVAESCTLTTEWKGHV